LEKLLATCEKAIFKIQWVKAFSKQY
jgi:hypothetical protein